MQAPDFWQTGQGPWPAILTPLAWGFELAGWIDRKLSRAYSAGVPVICIGNLTAGGTGKTPLAISTAALLARHGRSPHFLSRGYGGRRVGPERVDPKAHTALDVGDEPLLLAQHAPAWIARDRAAGARAAVQAGADCLVLDDGYQNGRLSKDLSLVVIDGETGFGNGRLIPAGPLREKPRAGLARADAAIIMGPDRCDLGDWLARTLPGLPVLRAALRPVDAERLSGCPVVAFAGIGRPEKFRETLLSAGADVIAFHGFPDHHPYRRTEIDALAEQATGSGARLVTTAKDAVRLAPADRSRIEILDIAAEWHDPPAFNRLLKQALASGAPAGPDRDGSGTG